MARTKSMFPSGPASPLTGRRDARDDGLHVRADIVPRSGRCDPPLDTTFRRVGDHTRAIGHSK